MFREQESGERRDSLDIDILNGVGQFVHRVCRYG